jgi:hypothetical protein
MIPMLDTLEIRTWLVVGTWLLFLLAAASQVGD